MDNIDLLLKIIQNFILAINKAREAGVDVTDEEIDAVIRDSQFARIELQNTINSMPDE